MAITNSKLLQEKKSILNSASAGLFASRNFMSTYIVYCHIRFRVRIRVRVSVGAMISVGDKMM